LTPLCFFGWLAWGFISRRKGKVAFFGVQKDS
jgi:hypothetical protein